MLMCLVFYDKKKWFSWHHLYKNSCSFIFFKIPDKACGYTTMIWPGLRSEAWLDLLAHCMEEHKDSIRGAELFKPSRVIFKREYSYYRLMDIIRWMLLIKNKPEEWQKIKSISLFNNCRIPTVRCNGLEPRWSLAFQTNCSLWHHSCFRECKSFQLLFL